MSIPDRKFSDRKNFDDNISQTANSGAKSPDAKGSDAKGSDAKSPDAKSPDANIAENKSKVIVIDSGCKDYYPQICDPFAGGFDNMGFARECAPYDSQKYARRQIYGYEHDWDHYAHVWKISICGCFSDILDCFYFLYKVSDNFISGFHRDR